MTSILKTHSVQRTRDPSALPPQDDKQNCHSEPRGEESCLRTISFWLEVACSAKLTDARYPLRTCSDGIFQICLCHAA